MSLTSQRNPLALRRIFDARWIYTHTELCCVSRRRNNETIQSVVCLLTRPDMLKSYP